MKKYIRFEIHQRNYSSNALVGIIEYYTEEGKRKEKSEYLLSFSHNLKKEEADLQIEKIKNLFSND